MKPFFVIGLLIIMSDCQFEKKEDYTAENQSYYEISKTDEEWKSILSAEEYYVLRQKGTERAHSSPLNKIYKKGIYSCAGCGAPLYHGERKYDSGTGWPSFDRAIEGSVSTSVETQFGQKITEVHCASCGGHLGHIFNDGPEETTGKRHCINGASLKFTDMENEKSQKQPNKYAVEKSEREWKEKLGEKRYHILRQAGTEYPHTGEYNLHFDKGQYVCGGCGAPLFNSDSKFESNCGWPSFDRAIEGAIEYKRDTSHGMIRTETLCSNCGGHLGHIFDDGPTETGQRYCINSLAMDFEKKK